MATHLPESNGHKGNPIEVTPIKGSAPQADEGKKLEQMENWQLEKDGSRLEEQIKRNGKEYMGRDDLNGARRKRLASIKAELRRRGDVSTQPSDCSQINGGTHEPGLDCPASRTAVDEQWQDKWTPGALVAEASKEIDKEIVHDKGCQVDNQ